MENVSRAEAMVQASNPQGPRITLPDVLAYIDTIDYFHPAEALPDPNGIPKTDPRWTSTVCVCVLKNGFLVYGMSTPAAPENFNAEVGRKLAHEQCIREIWPLMGYSLREKLHGESSKKESAA